MSLDELNPNKQDWLARLNNLLTNMCFSNYSPKYSKMYSVGYNMMCQSMDKISTELAMLKGNFSLPNEANEEFPNCDECKLHKLDIKRLNCVWYTPPPILLVKYFVLKEKSKGFMSYTILLRIFYLIRLCIAIISLAF